MNKKKWAWWEILLWAYSTLYMLFIASVYAHYSIVPFVSMHNPSTTENKILFILVLPILFFLIWEGVGHLRDHDSGKDMPHS